MRIQRLICIAVLLLLFVISSTAMATNEEPKVLKLTSESGTISYNGKNVNADSVYNINNVDLSKYDSILINNIDLKNKNVSDKIKNYLANGNKIIVIGEHMKRSDVLASLGYNNVAEFKSVEGRYKLADKETYDENIDPKRKMQEYIDPFEDDSRSDLTYKMIAINTVDFDNNIAHTILLPDTHDDEQMNDEINDLITNKIGLLATGDPTPPSGSVLKDSYSISKYVEGPFSSSENAFKWQSSGKIYKETSETDPNYNYYWMWTNDTFTSGDYLYNNEYEIDTILIRDDINEGTGVSILDYTPVDKQGTSSVSGTLDLVEGSVTLSFSPGGEIDILTDGGTGEDSTTWGIFHSNTSFWLPSKLNFKTAIEFKVNDSDSKFEVRSAVNVDIERYLSIEGTYADGNILVINDN